MRELEGIQPGFELGGETFGGIGSVAVSSGEVKEGALGIVMVNHEMEKD